MARILLFDIETAPIEAWVWGIWNVNVGTNMLKTDWNMLTWAAKWLDEDEILYDSNHFYSDDPRDDTDTLQTLWELLDEADIVVAHNGNRFDIPKVNARFITAGMAPPSPYRKIDTLREARKHFKFTSNRLDFVGQALGVGAKMDTGGFSLWARCMDGEPTAFEEMIEYNCEDVRLLERVYLKLRPWMTTHPNLGAYNDDEAAQCPKCESKKIHWRGKVRTQTQEYHRFQCQDCGGWGRARTTSMPKEKRKNLVTNAG
jgi:hypothetical protein